MTKTQQLAKLPGTGYQIGIVEQREGSAGPYIFVGLAPKEPGDTFYFREDIASHVQQVLEIMHPNLTYQQVTENGRDISIIGYDDRRKAYLKLRVEPGSNRAREVSIKPVINPDGFVPEYMKLLERDLVK